jgi:ubiquinol-cytochrome c reductase iron-sulfur subunit
VTDEQEPAEAAEAPSAPAPAGPGDGETDAPINPVSYSSIRADTMTDRQLKHGGERLPAVLFVVAILGIAGFVVAYFKEANNQVLGILVAIGMFGIGAGMVVWAKRFMTPPHPEVEDRGRLASTEEEIEAFHKDFELGEYEFERRGLLTKLLVGALGVAGLAALVPFRSLGPEPGPEFTETPWRFRKRVVTENGQPVKADAVGTNSVITVFPEGDVGDELAQTVLIGLRPNELQVSPGRETWTPNNVAAFSKVCTHAGCPVGLYQAAAGLLICPCHQSTFNVYEECAPVFGPAATPLPQLPLAIDGDGYLVSQGDFSSPPGPGFWDQDRGESGS